MWIRSSCAIATPRSNLIVKLLERSARRIGNMYETSAALNRPSFLCVVVALSGCASIADDWNSARRLDTIEGYTSFINGHKGNAANEKQYQIMAAKRRLILQNFPKLQVGMSVDQVASLIEVPPPEDSGNLREMTSMISMAKTMRAAGASINYSQRFCRYRGDDECIVATTPEEGEVFIQKLRRISERHRYNDEYELFFDENMKLERWRQTGSKEWVK